MTAQYCLSFFTRQNRLHVGFQGIQAFDPLLEMDGVFFWFRFRQRLENGMFLGVKLEEYLPREVHRQGTVEKVAIQHNRNDNLRANKKMIQSVCMPCHGLGFSINALADTILIENNFNGALSKL